VTDGARTRDHWNHNPGLYQLSYSHHNCTAGTPGCMARPEGLEPPTHGLEGRCSIRLSYGRSCCFPSGPSWTNWLHGPQAKISGMVGVEGFEPPTFCSQSRRATRLRYTPPTRKAVLKTREGRHSRGAHHTHDPVARQRSICLICQVNNPQKDAADRWRNAGPVGKCAAFLPSENLDSRS
jgi:hypothetical protein